MSDTLTVHVAATADDYAAAQSIFARQRRNNWSTWLWLLPSSAIMAIIMFTLPAALDILFKPPGGVSFLVATAAGYFAFLMSWRLFITFGYKTPLDPKGSFLSPTDIELAPDGIRWKSELREGRTAWNAVNRVVETKSHIYLFIDRAAAHVIPKRSFSSEAAAREFAEDARRLVNANSTK
ncbi:MAG TPA: YcxB family protein [Rhizomicrobium sp.]|nr:YcxB family protein [Rhizomicrobium sp.]